MPIITEITDSFECVETENVNMSNAKSKTNKLKQWMHLNHILNCKSTLCKTYKMVQGHLLQLRKIDTNDIILIRTDYHLGSYSDAILTIVCTDSENCNICLKLLDHLSCQKRYCDCNNYKDICHQQLRLRQVVEKSSQPGRLFNKYNAQHCSTPTKEKIKSLGKYHQEAIKVVQGLKDTTQARDNSGDIRASDKPTTNKHLNPNVANSMKKSTDRNSSEKNDSSCVTNKDYFKNNCESSKEGVIDDESTVNTDAYAVTPYQPQTSQSSIFSDEELIGSSYDESDSDEANFTSFSAHLGNGSFVHAQNGNWSNVRVNSFYTTTSLQSTSSSSDSDGFLNVDSDSSLEFESNTRSHNINYRKINSMGTFVNSCNINLDESSSEDSEEISVSVTDNSKIDCGGSSTFIKAAHNPIYGRNVSGNTTHRNSMFSDESFFDDGNDSSSDDDVDFINSCHSTKKKYNINRTSMFSGESVVGDSDDDLFEFTDGTPSNFNTNSQFNLSEENCSDDDGTGTSSHIRNRFMRNSLSTDDTGGVIIVDVTDKNKSELDKFVNSSSNYQHEGTSSQGTSGIASQSTTTSINEPQNIFASTPLLSATSHCKGNLETTGHSSDCWFCGIDDSMSKCDSFTDASLSHLHEVSQSSEVVHKPQHKKSPNKGRVSFQKNSSPRMMKSKQQQKRHQGFQNTPKRKRKAFRNMGGKKDSPSTSGYVNQRNFSKKMNKPNASNRKSSSFGDINYSYVRNVLSQQNAQAGRNTTVEKRKNVTKKQSPVKKKKKLKLYDTSTWIESSNFVQLCHSDTKRC